MKARDGVLIVLAMTVGYAAAFILDTEYGLNTRDMIYTPLHVANELVILLAALYLVAEAWIHIRGETCRSVRANFGRYTRIMIGAGIMAVHLTVFFSGGY